MDSQQLSNAQIKKLLSQASKTPPRHRHGEKFLKGPIPLDWLSTAARLPGKTLHFALAMWFQAGISNRRKVTVGGKLCRQFGVGRKAASESVRRLENARLILVKRRDGCSPKLTINDPICG